MKIVVMAGLVAALAAPLLADILITKDGRVFIGNIDPEKGPEEDPLVTVRWPYKKISFRGAIKFPRRDIRWYKRGIDAPDKEYYKLFPESELRDAPPTELLRMASTTDAPEAEAIEEYAAFAESLRKLREELEKTVGPSESLTVATNPAAVPQDRVWELTAKVTLKEWKCSIQPPEGWRGQDIKGIYVFYGDADASGYRPQIHVVYYEKSPLKELLGEKGLLMFGHNKITKENAKTIKAVIHRSDIVDPVTKGWYQTAGINSLIEKDGRKIKVRKTYYLGNGACHVVTSYNLESSPNSLDQVIQRSLNSFEPSR